MEQKPTVIYIPGTLISPEVFRKIKTPEGFGEIRLSWMDAPGSHDVREVAKALAGRIEAEGLGPVILAGHSSGGSIAMLTYLALKDRTRVGGMILSNTGANNNGHSNQKSREELIASWNYTELDLFVRKCFKKPLDADMYETLMEYGKTISAEVRVEPLMSQREIDLSGRLPEITCPTVIAHGKLDTIRTLSHAEELSAGIPHAELVLLDAGHSPMYEDPDTWQAVLNRLAAKIMNP